MISVLGFPITPTIFPDNTSQVWKLNLELIKNLQAMRNNGLSITIEWDFEKESELIHIAQLKELLEVYSKEIELFIPYLPYARQDKIVSNESTFALKSFAKLLNTLHFHAITAVDIHSKVATKEINRLWEHPANKYFKPNEDIVLCYPDKGAEQRYKNQFINNYYIVLDKKRNQLTGAIEGLQFQHEVKLKPTETICIIDDICDGGRTFIEAAKLLKTLNPKEIHLYISHGIFSKGLQPLIDAGFKRIFTHKGEVNIKDYFNNTIEEA